MQLSLAQRGRYIGEKLRSHKLRRDAQNATLQDPVLLRRARVSDVTSAAVGRYTPGIYDGPVGLFLPNKEWMHSRAEPLRWRAVAPHAEQYFGPDNSNPDVLLLDPDAPVVADLFRQCREKHAGAASP